MPEPQFRSELPKSFSRVARNSLFVLAAKGIDIGTRIILVALIARYLGINLFGEFAFIMGLVSFLLPLTDFGVERIIVREITNQIERANEYMNSALMLRAALAIIMIGSIVLVTQVLNWESRKILALYIASGSQVFISFGLIFLGVFRAFEEMHYQTILTLVHQSIKLVCVLLVIIYDLGFVFVFLAWAFADLIKMILQYLTVSMKFFKPFPSFNWSLCKKLLKESYPLGIFAVIAVASFRVDIFVLQYFHGAVAVSLFEVPHRIIMQMQLLPASIVIALYPSLSRVASSARSALKDVYEKAFKFLFLLSLPITIALVIWAREVIVVVFGKDFGDAAVALSYLGWSICFLFLVSLTNFTLIAIGRQTMTTISVGVCFCVNLLLDLVLVPKYGYVGASVATLISYGCFFLCSFYFLAREVVKIELMPIIFKGCVSGVVMAGLCGLSKGLGFMGSFLGFVFGSILYVFLLIKLGVLCKEEIVNLRLGVKEG
ncbi:MAG: flippase [Candidatus Thorarchaeota archaeon]